jgi:hypothetical protein
VLVGEVQDSQLVLTLVGKLVHHDQHAAVVIEAADEIDRWATRCVVHLPVGRC